MSEKAKEGCWVEQERGQSCPSAKSVSGVLARVAAEKSRKSSGCLLGCRVRFSVEAMAGKALQRSV